MKDLSDKNIEKDYYYSFNVLRLILPLFVCYNSFGIAVQNNGSVFVQALCGFASITFFVMTGFLLFIKPEEFEKKLSRAIKRTVKLFAIVVVFYIILNVIYAVTQKSDMFLTFKDYHTWINFIVFNQWPLLIGENIWFLQCILYGYIALFILNKLRLLKHDWLIVVICMGIALVSGELSGLIEFKFFSYDHITATVITRSLPYLLLGKIIAGQKEKIKTGKHSFVYALMVALGFVFTVGEYGLLYYTDSLNYTGHFLGNGLIAAAIVILAVRMRETSKFIDFDYSNIYAKLVYVLHQPIGFLAIAIASVKNQAAIRYLIPLLPVIVCVTIFVICLLTNELLYAKIYRYGKRRD